MPKGYFLSIYRAVREPDKVAAYAKLAGPAITKAGGRFLARGGVVRTCEAGLDQRTVVIEFDSVAQAVAMYESADYQAALAALDGGAERDIRIVEGVD